MLLLMLVAGISGAAAQSLSISDFSIKAGESKDFQQWVLFPDDNGTILMQSKDGKASISIGNNSYSFVCTKDGKVDAGQDVKFSAASALKTLRALA